MSLERASASYRASLIWCNILDSADWGAASDPEAHELRKSINFNATNLMEFLGVVQAEEPMTTSKDGPLYGAWRPTEGGCIRLLSHKYLRRRHRSCATYSPVGISKPGSAK